MLTTSYNPITSARASLAQHERDGEPFDDRLLSVSEVARWLFRLCPGENPTSWTGVRDNPDGSQDVLLGKPIIRITHEQIFDASSTERISEVLEGWVAIDQENIVNRRAGMNWVVGPRAYETGKPLSGAHGGIFYWHPQNLQKCTNNLGRCATALWNLVEGHRSLPNIPEPWKTGIPLIKELLLWMRGMDPNLGAFIRNLDE